MRTKTVITALLSIMMLACMSGAAFAGRATIYYGGGIQPISPGFASPHRYAFVPDPELQAKLSPTPKDVPKLNMVENPEKTGAQGNYQWGNRYTYRSYFQAAPKVGGKTAWSMGSKLGTAFPTTIYNKDIGKGRELSRIFK